MACERSRLHPQQKYLGPIELIRGKLFASFHSSIDSTSDTNRASSSFRNEATTLNTASLKPPMFKMSARSDPDLRIRFGHGDKLLSTLRSLQSPVRKMLATTSAYSSSTQAAWSTMISKHPGKRAPDLAVSMGMETKPFKINIRKLKELGLTESLSVGYRLSPRGNVVYNRLIKRRAVP